MKKPLHVISILIILLSVIVSSLGLFYSNDGTSYDVINQYGDTIKMFGDGIYKHDSFFMAPIFRGTDFTILFAGIPLLILSLIIDVKKHSKRTKLFLTSVIAIFLYYAASIAFGVTYNILHLLYIALFGLSFFGLIIGIQEIQKLGAITVPVDFRKIGINIFLIVVGISLFVAWLPDIISSLLKGKPLALIEIYTTAITYVLDIGIISPLCFICLYLVSKRKSLGFILLGIILILCAFVGILVLIQSIFQMNTGIVLPIQALITKVGIFILLAFFAVFFARKLFWKIA
jgi:hypothetical protein